MNMKNATAKWATSPAQVDSSCDLFSLCDKRVKRGLKQMLIYWQHIYWDCGRKERAVLGREGGHRRLSGYGVCSVDNLFLMLYVALVAGGGWGGGDYPTCISICWSIFRCTAYLFPLPLPYLEILSARAGHMGVLQK